MNTSYATAGDPAARHAIHPTIRRYRGSGRGSRTAGAPLPEMPVHASRGDQEPQKGGVSARIQHHGPAEQVVQEMGKEQNRPAARRDERGESQEQREEDDQALQKIPSIRRQMQHAEQKGRNQPRDEGTDPWIRPAPCPIEGLIQQREQKNRQARLAHDLDEHDHILAERVRRGDTRVLRRVGYEGNQQCRYIEGHNRQDEDAPETEEPPHGLAGPPQRVERMRPVSHGKQGGRQSCEGQDLPPRALEQIAHEDRSSQNGQDGCEDPRDRTLRCAEKLSRQVQTHACPGEGLPERIEYPPRLIRRQCGAVHDIIPRTTVIPMFHVSPFSCGKPIRKRLSSDSRKFFPVP